MVLNMELNVDKVITSEFELNDAECLLDSGKNKFTVTKVKDSELHDHAVNTTKDIQKNGIRSHTMALDEQTVLLPCPVTPTDSLTGNSITAVLSNKWRDISKRVKVYGEKTKFRKRLVSKWESLNYETVENDLYFQQLKTPSIKRQLTLQFIHRWFNFFLVGILTALTAAILHVVVEKLCNLKFGLIKGFLDRCSKEGCMYQPALIWIGLNVSIACLGSALVLYLEPVAAGGGIPLIKAYLNGVKIPGLLTLECYVAKMLGVVMTTVGGLAGGKEGPMAHAGSIIGAGVGKGRIRFFKNKSLSLYAGFRDDHETRDLVSGGAASGVSAAFGAPVGGTLFAVEEAASFWSQSLTWRVFFSAMIACFFTNFLLSCFHGTPSKLSDPGLVRLDVFPTSLEFDLIEIPAFVIIGIIGGLMGAAFVVLNYKLSVFRKRFIKVTWLKIAEAGFAAGLSGLITFLLFSTLNYCADDRYNPNAIVTQMNCPENQHHSLSTYFLASPEGALKALLHDPFGSISAVPLAMFVISYFFFALWTVGLTMSAGLFIPSLLLGASWGRLCGIVIVHIFPGDREHYEQEVGKYALIGAASMLGGIMRTTISLTVMIVECTGETTFGLPIMIVLMISKWVGDFISVGVYEMNLEVSGIPLLPWEPPALCDTIKASDIMNVPALTLNKIERVGNIVSILRNETFCGFPVIDSKRKDQTQKKLRGLILRFQLLVLLKHKIFAPQNAEQPNTLRLKDFRKCDLQFLKIKDIQLSTEEMDQYVDLRPYLSPDPYTIQPSFSLPRLFRLFRGLGLRHLIVVNDCFEPIGMITRKDMAKFRSESKKGLIKVQHLTVEDK